MNKPTEVDLLLIGKTGNGKSATGNSILCRKAFVRSGSSQSVTSEIQSEYSEYKDYILKVVDSPGVCDTNHVDKKAVKIVSKALKRAMIMNPKGYHAFVLVVRFGVRFTGEEQYTIRFLKGFFGPSFVRDFCILVMTGADNFAAEFDDRKITFESWCQEQQGALRELLEECEHRIVLFDNNTKDESIKEKQLMKLIYLAIKVSGGKRYSDKHFEDAKFTRKRIMLEANAPIINEKIRKETSLIIQKLEQIQESKDVDSNKQRLRKLRERCEKLLQETVTKDKGTNVLGEILDSIKMLQTNINNELKFIERMKIEREESRKREEELMTRFEERSQEMTAQFEKMKKEMEEEMERREQAERNRLIKEKEETERKYKEATDKSNQSLLSKLYDWFASWFSKSKS